MIWPLVFGCLMFALPTLRGGILYIALFYNWLGLLVCVGLVGLLVVGFWWDDCCACSLVVWFLI